MIIKDNIECSMSTCIHCYKGECFHLDPNIGYSETDSRCGSLDKGTGSAKSKSGSAGNSPMIMVIGE
jgi:hypothetical protein